MLKDKPILKFAGIFLLSYFILTGLTQYVGLDTALNATIRGLSRATLQTTFPKLKINTKPEKEGPSVNDNKMIVEFEWSQAKVDEAIAEARRTGQRDLQVPYRFISYLIFEFFLVPIFFLLSLILATPMERMQKLKFGSMAIGVLLAFLLFKLYLMTLFSVSKSQIDVYELGYNTMKRLQWVASLMTMGFSVMMAFFLWLILIFRNSRLKDLINTWFNQLVKS